MTARAGLPLLLLAALLAAGCRRDDQKTESVQPEDVRRARAELAPALRAQLDSGNAVFHRGREAARAGNGPLADSLTRAALRHYREAARLDDDEASAWFGVYMAEAALGNEDAANRAMKKAQSAAPGATIMHPGDSAGGAP